MRLEKHTALKRIGAYRKHRKECELKSALISHEDLKAILEEHPGRGIRVFPGDLDQGELTLVYCADVPDAEPEACEAPATVYYGSIDCPPICIPPD